MFELKTTAASTHGDKKLPLWVYLLILSYLLFPHLGMSLDFAGIETKLPVAKLVAMLAMLFLFTSGRRTGNRSTLYLGLPVLGFVATELLSSLFAANSTTSLFSSVNDLLLVALFTLLVLGLELSEDEVLRIYRFARSTLTVVSVLIILDFVLNTNVVLRLTPAFLQGGTEYAWTGMQERMGRIRAVGPYGQAIGASFWMSVNIGLYLFVPAKRYLYKALGVMISSIAMLCTLTRAGIVGTIVVVTLFTLVYVMKKAELKFKLTSIVVVGLVFWASMVIPEFTALTWGSISAEAMPTQIAEGYGYTLEAPNLAARLQSAAEIGLYYAKQPFQVLGAGTFRYGTKEGLLLAGLPQTGYITALYPVLLIEVGPLAVFFFLLFFYRVSKLLLKKIDMGQHLHSAPFLTALWILGIYAMTTFSIQLMPDPVLLLLVLLPFTIKDERGAPTALSPGSDLRGQCV